MSGTVIYDTTSADPNATGDEGPVNFAGATLGDSFTTPAATTTITGLQFLFSDSHVTDNSTITVSLHTDSNDPTSDATLVANLGTIDAASVVAAITTAGSVSVSYTFTPTSSPTLDPSTRYWIDLSDSDGGSGINWEYTNISASDAQYSEYNYSFGQVQGNSAGPQILQITAACFAAGTRILTAGGEVAVEALRPGAMLAVMREGGFAPMRWLGHRRVDCRRHPRPHDVWPVRIAPGAFGRGRPARALMLSPDHAVFVADPALGAAGALVPIRYLLNGATIRQTPVDSVAYYHVELERHDVLLADGLAAESYLDTGNRGAFANADGACTMAHPDFARRVWSEQACAPLLTDGPVVAALRARLHAEAEARGFAVTVDPDLHLLVDGVRIDGERQGGVYAFELPEVHGDATSPAVWLVSRGGVPAELNAETSDARRLGVAVSQVVADGTVLSSLGGEGWYPPEELWHWTNGMASLRCAAARRVEVTVALAGRYWLAPGGPPAAPPLACAA